MAGKKRVRRTRAAKKGGHPFLVLLFFIALIMGSAYMTDRMTNAPDSEVAQNVTTIGHLFNDKEMQGLVPKEDQGTPESVKEKIKAAMDKVVTVQVKADDEEPAGSSVSSNEKKDGSQTMEKGKKASFSLPSIVSKITGNEESHENTAAPFFPAGKANGSGFLRCFIYPFVHCFCFLLCPCVSSSRCSFREEECRTTKGSCQTECSSPESCTGSFAKAQYTFSSKGKAGRGHR